MFNWFIDQPLSGLPAIKYSYGNVQVQDWTEDELKAVNVLKKPGELLLKTTLKHYKKVLEVHGCKI